MVALSRPLWVDLDDFPTVPLLGRPTVAAPSWMPVALAVGLLVGLTRSGGRAAIGGTAALIAWLVVGDQLRLQPWVYQFLVMGGALAVLPPGEALGGCRVFLIALYVHSGLSKLDASFVREIGLLFARTLAGVVGWGGMPEPGGWVLAMPAGEIAVGALLAWPRSRRVGCVGATLMHATLLLILGPAGLGHSTIVLVWNAALIVEGWLLFWPSGESEGAEAPSTGGWSLRSRCLFPLLVLIVIGPIGERWGWLDSWPSHALYASHCERSTVLIRDDDRFRRLPTALRRACGREPGGSAWRLDLTGWCRSTRGVPATPQARYANGMAEWVADRLGPGPPGDGSVSVEHALRADARSGRRIVVAARDREQIRAIGERYWFNAHPKADPRSRETTDAYRPDPGNRE